MHPEVTLSIVSHGHGALVATLLADISRYVTTPVRVLLTLNVPEIEEKWFTENPPFEVQIVRNTIPKGFGENHNAALARSNTDLFCVLNPDIRLTANPFPPLVALLKNPGIGVAAPSVVGRDLTPEDHARAFPSLFTLIAKALGARGHSPPPSNRSVYYPDWVAGMFMLFRSETLRSMHGFDERYFLYYEDVDLCARLRNSGFEIAVSSEVSVVHDARRESRRNLRFAKWHLRSALRFFASQPRIALGLGRKR